MNFEFSDEQFALRDEFRGFVADHKPIERLRRGIDAGQPCDLELWQKAASLGWSGVTIAEEHGGTALGHELLCLVAEEAGRTLAPLPFSTTVYMAAEAIRLAGTQAQQAALLPRIVAGEVATFALGETTGDPQEAGIRASATATSLTGVKTPVLDADAASFAVVAARGAEGLGLYVVDLKGPGVERKAIESLDPGRSLSTLVFDQAPAERLAGGPGGWPLVRAILDRAAILVAFEQVGAAEACLEMATEYAKQRYAFGRPIGSFQAIKHKLADMYVALQLARSNAYYGAYALGNDTADLPVAAAAARISATAAFDMAARESIQVHGGIGYTTDLDCHLYYRRARLLALMLGSPTAWKAYFIDQLGASGATAG